MDVPRLAILSQFQAKPSTDQWKSKRRLPLVLKSEQKRSSLVQMWDDVECAVLSGAILNQGRDD